MGDPVYLLQIVDKRGVVARLPGGGALERDLIETLLSKVPYVGVLRTDAQVRAAVRKAVADVLTDLKNETTTI